MVDVGKRVKKARQAAGLTQVELAKKINVSRSYIGNIEQNRHASSVATLQLIAEALHVDIAEFVGNGNTLQETGLANDEIHLLTKYRSLSSSDKELAQAMLDRFVAPVKSAKSTTWMNYDTSKMKVNAAGLG